MKILVPVDGSEFTKRMLAYLAAHDEWLGDHHEYTVMHVAPAVPPRAAAALDKAVLKSHYDETAEKVFKPIRTFFTRHQMKSRFVSKVGPAGDLIAEAADKGGFDIVIMGSHGQGSLLKLVMGSVTTRVMAQCKVPVLVIR